MHVSKPEADGVLANPRVLLIEDDEAVAQAMVRSIERSGMNVAFAATGAKGMALKASFNPDVVLVDLELPDTNGVDLIGWFAEQRTCGVIVVSGMGEEADRIVGLELGADDYIVKPPRMREMIGADPRRPSPRQPPGRIRNYPHARAKPLRRPDTGSTSFSGPWAPSTVAASR